MVMDFIGKDNIDDESMCGFIFIFIALGFLGVFAF